ncbi:MAG: hypothetical protein D6746_09760 [Bacteroidetes bacterium]|nr:MAG: hypothetical protein D6746_09760 [Bacteroidota bacterium]GIV58342.1 MAG: hypothetical protein KatS3mg042_1255 [Rhodothermaceae bacterium]
MYPSTYPHKIVLLTTGFQLPSRRLLFGRARLYLDRIELTGWQVGERYHDVIPLGDIMRIDWNLEARREANVVFHRAEGPPTALILHQVGLWKHTLEERLRWGSPGRFRLAQTPPPPDMPLGDLITFASGMG